MHAVCIYTCGGQKRVLDPEVLQAVVSCPVWILGIKLGSSGRVVGVLNNWAISLVATPFFLKLKVCVCVCMCVCKCTHAIASMWLSDNNSQESGLNYNLVRSGWGADWGHQACVQAPLPTKLPCQPLRAPLSLFRRNGDTVSHCSPIWFWIGSNLPTSASW